MQRVNNSDRKLTIAAATVETAVRAGKGHSSTNNIEKRQHLMMKGTIETIYCNSQDGSLVIASIMKETLLRPSILSVSR